MMVIGSHYAHSSMTIMPIYHNSSNYELKYRVEILSIPFTPAHPRKINTTSNPLTLKSTPILSTYPTQLLKRDLTNELGGNPTLPKPPTTYHSPLLPDPSLSTPKPDTTSL